MLLRHGAVWNSGTPADNLRATWVREYVAWARAAELRLPSVGQVLVFFLENVPTGIERCREIKGKCLEVLEPPRFKAYVDAPARLRGDDRVAALAYVVAMDDCRRYAPSSNSKKAFFNCLRKWRGAYRLRIMKVGRTAIEAI